MSDFPMMAAGHPVQSQEELRELVREHAHSGPLRRQDEHPAEAWLADMEDTPALRSAMRRLVVEMVRLENDPVVLRMIIVLAGVGEEFAEAAARRLVEGPPVPDAPGAGFATIAEDLWHRAQGVGDPALLRRLVAIGRPLDLLRLSIARRDPAIVEALERAVKAGEVPVPVVGTVAMLVARNLPEQIGRAAAAVRSLSQAHRQAFLQEAVEASPGLRGLIEAALR